jgi:energy-coupling factor transport system ATP-binding protein
MTDSVDQLPAVEFDAVEFSYVSGTPVLQGIDVTFGQDEFITIIGQNGSGKSTLVKHINGLLTPDTGTVRVSDGETAYDTSTQPMEMLASIVGYVFQNPDDQIFHTSVQKEIEYGLKNVGVPEEERRKRTKAVLEKVGLGGREQGNPFQFGKGERQRLAIASVLAMEPQVICIDEPTTGQDRTEAVNIMEILKRYNERGHTVITITHDIELAARYTGRVVVIGDGDIIADGPPSEVFSDSAHLEQTNIRPPQITQLSLALEEQKADGRRDDVWLTVDEAYSRIASSANTTSSKLD